MGTQEASYPKDEASPQDSEQAGIEPESADLERLGRERPKCFPGPWSEISFCISIFMSQILAVSCQIALTSVAKQMLTFYPGILHLRLKCPPTHTGQRA
jgi:hypothetical protein